MSEGTGDREESDDRSEESSAIVAAWLSRVLVILNWFHCGVIDQDRRVRVDGNWRMLQLVDGGWSPKIEQTGAMMKEGGFSALEKRALATPTLVALLEPRRPFPNFPRSATL